MAKGELKQAKKKDVIEAQGVVVETLPNLLGSLGVFRFRRRA